MLVEPYLQILLEKEIEYAATVGITG